MKTLGLVLATALTAVPLTAKADTVINLNATDYAASSTTIVQPNNLAPTYFYTTTLAAGLYSLSVIGTTTPGAVYNGWNQAAQNYNGTANSGSAAPNEWEERIGVNTTGGTFNTNYTYSPYPNTDPEPFTGVYSSAAAALAAAQSTGPFMFMLGTTTTVTFYIPDEGNSTYPNFLDNTGGVSLILHQASASPVPEPSSLLLLATGALSAAAAVRRRLRG